jgi:hypothetical protein
MAYEVERPAIGSPEESFMALTEVFRDSAGLRYVGGHPDSIHSEKGEWIRGPLESFEGWYDAHRIFVDSMMRSTTGERFRTMAFTAIVPFPVDPVGSGDSWSFGRRADYQIQIPLWGPVPCEGHGTIERIEVADGDTLATIRLHLEVRRHELQDDIRGQLDGDEVFSVSRGLTIRLELSGRVEREDEVNGPMGLRRLSVPFTETIERTLLP